MPLPIAVPIALGGLSFLSGLAKPKPSTTSGSSTSTTTPTFDPRFQGLLDSLLKTQSAKLRNPTQASQSVINQQLQDTNEIFDVGAQGIINKMAGAGIRGGSGAIGAGIATGEGNRLSALAQVQNQKPLMERQFQNEDIASILETLGLGRGSTTVGSSKGSATQPGGGIMGGIDSVGSILGFMAANGMLGGAGKKAPGGFSLGS
jgi:hypothetical protein